MNQQYDMGALRERLQFIGLDPSSRERLRGVKGVIEGSIKQALDTFYDRVRSTPQTSRFFNDDRHMQSAKGRQESHWSLIANAEFDERYVAGVSAVGKAHARLGLEPRWYIGGYALLVEQLVTAVLRDRWPSRFGRGKADEVAKEVGVVIKAAMLDMDYAISVYLDELAEARAAAEAEKQRAQADRQAALEKLGVALDQLALGDLQKRLATDLPPEFTEMAENFNKAVLALHDVIADVRATSRAIVGGTEGIANAAEDLSRRTEQQASSLEESSAALHQLAESVRTTAENAAQAADVVGQTQAEAQESGRVVASAVEAMAKINTSSKSIAAIVGVIDEIAFQTNLLALNAGVEAARAGEAGRGFAVVAQEVRSLAQRCAESAKEIKELITNSEEHVASGVSSVGETGEALGRIVERISEITQLVSGIAAAAAEQSRGIGEVNSAVAHLDKITQQNAAMVEETSAESRRLKAEALELSGKLDRFKVSEAGHQSGRAASEQNGRRAASPGHRAYAPARTGSRGPALALAANPQVEDDESWTDF
jgi:methyl-accepting chemotaxis protein